VLPSFAAVGPLSVTVGATLAIVTVRLSLSLPPSPSLMVTLTVLLAGPSGKVQSKLPAPVVGLKAPFESVPLAPHVSVSRLNVSEPGSLTV
jgi:hypothetical protein